MKKDRREFIKLTGGLALGTLFTQTGCTTVKSTAPDVASLPGENYIKDFGIQLWTVRDDMAKDPAGVLKQLASFGYKQIESFEGGKGMFWGMGNTGFKKYLDDQGMKVVSSHCDIHTGFEKKAAEAAEIGMKYLVCPWLGPQKTIDDYKKAAEKFNKCGEVCKKEGILFAYHNHDYSFKLTDGQVPQEVLMNETDPALVDFEMDIYWVATAGEDAEAWMKKHKNRFRLSHIKDRSKTPGTDNGKNSVDLGTGNIPFKKILKTAIDTGMKYFIVEQEAFPNGTPLQAVKADADYMKKLKLG